MITVYLWGVGQHLSTRKAVYEYTKSHLSEWFPKLPSYQAFCRRLNWLAGAFQALAEIFGEKMLEKSPDTHAYVVDSMPIMLAHRSNSTRAKVGLGWAAFPAEAWQERAALLHDTILFAWN